MATTKVPRAANGEPSASRSDHLYAQLRRAIVQGELRPNQRLVETELADMLDVSRTPIREALQRLAIDGLVSRRRGWEVREHDADEIEQIYDCRAALEGYAARLAALHATDAQLDEIAGILFSISDTSDRDAMVAVNERFHEAIIDATGNPLLAELATRSRLYYFNRRVAHLYTEAETAHSRQQHIRLLEALRGRDPDRAEAITREHIATALQAILGRREVPSGNGFRGISSPSA
jgi:DNA-binding GntR family transcriptional regulator